MSRRIPLPVFGAAFFLLGGLSAFLLLNRPGPESISVEPSPPPAPGDPAQTRETSPPASPPAGNPQTEGLRAEVERLRAENERLRAAGAAPSAGPGPASEPGGQPPAPLGSRTAKGPGAPAVLPAPGFGAIEGRVYQVLERPVAGVKIRASLLPNRGTFEAVTDASGYYRVSGTPPGSYGVKAEGETIADRVWPYRTVQVREGQTALLDFGGPGWVFVSGRAVSGTEEPIEDGFLEVRDGTSSLTTVTYSGGGFVLGFLTPGTYTWSITGNHDHRAYGTGTVEVPQDRSFVCELRGQPTSLAGVVLEAGTGSPLPDVSLTLEGEGDVDVRLHASTGPTGAFSFEGMPSGSYRIEIWCDGFAPLLSEAFRVEPGRDRRDLRLVLHRPLRVEVRVRDARGLPVTDFDLDFLVGDVVANPLATCAFGEADGVARVDDVAPGTYTLRVTARGYKPAYLMDRSFAAGANPPLDIVLERR